MGGATRIPAVREFARELFQREPLELDPDLAVARGAAVQAALCLRDAAVEELMVTDVASHSLGVEVVDNVAGRHFSGRFSPVIHRNTVLPTSQVESFLTVERNQREMTLEVFEGESPLVSGNRLLGCLKVRGIPKGPPGQEVVVRFTLDLDGLLEIESIIASTGKTARLVLDREGRVLNVFARRKVAAHLKRLRAGPAERDPALVELLSRGERAWSDCGPAARPALEEALEELEQALAGRNSPAIRIAARGLEQAIAAALGALG